MSGGDFVKIVEVGPRDGLQNEQQSISTDDKVDLIDRLSAAGLPAVEATAFVSPKWVPQMADHADVMARISRVAGTTYPVLVPNSKGYDSAKAAGATEVAVFAAASEAFSQRNINCSIDESLERFAPVFESAARDGIDVRGYISCALGCPYQGEVNAHETAKLAGKLIDMGCYEVCLADTIGTGTAGSARELFDAVGDLVPVEKLAGHFHDTYGQALANILAVLEQGVRVIDSAVAGLGGCPYAKGATGNVATEDVLYMLHGLGLETSVDLDAVLEAGWLISDVLGRSPNSRVSTALRNKRTHGRGGIE